MPVWEKCIAENIAEFDRLPLFSKEVERLQKKFSTDKIGIGPVGRSRDSTLLEESNFEVIWKDLHKKYPQVVEIERLGHWGVGWVEGIVWKAYNKNGAPSNVAVAVCDWEDQLNRYPVADEDAYSDAVYEATIEGVKMAIGSKVSKQKQSMAARDVYSWLSEHEEEEVDNVDDRGGYPSDEAVDRALTALEYVKTEVNPARFKPSVWGPQYVPLTKIGDLNAASRLQRALQDGGVDSARRYSRGGWEIMVPFTHKKEAAAILKSETTQRR